MAEHLGHRDNPFRIALPGDLDHACARVWDPTPGQARADNYKMAHTVIGGLAITIETPRGRMRHGAGQDGKPWSVRMPAHYGYVKRSTAADGDQVDVYVGEQAHAAEALPVWIIDQVHKETGKYDEAKVFVGFPDSRTARDAYLGAFDDGRGADRIGAVSRTTFDGLKRWLASGDTKKPVAMGKSAWAATGGGSYGPATCRCVGSCGCETLGGSMPEPVVIKTDPGQGFMSRMAALLSKGLSSMTPGERNEFLADAAVQAGASIAKAEEAMNTVGEGHDRIPLFEDLWDGPPDDRLKTVRAHGPESHAKSGETPVGPSQAASGNGAEKMEGEYSRHASQRGVQRATEMLGEAIAGIKAMKSAMLSIADAVKTQGTQIEVLKGGTAAVSAGPDAKAIEDMISAAVAKATATVDRAVAKSVRAAMRGVKVVKAEGETDNDTEDDDEDAEDEDEDDEAEQAESGSGTDIEIVNENDAEDEDEAEDDEAKKAIVAKAARFRIMAKGRIKWAGKRFAKAEELEEGGKPKKAERHRRMGKGNLRKAREYLAMAKALRDGHLGPSGQAIAKSIHGLAVKAKKPKEAGGHAENQTTWPNKDGAGKSVVAQPDAAKALETVALDLQKAMSGMALLTTTVGGMMEALGKQSRGEGGGMPPAYHIALAKAGADELTTKAGEIDVLANSGAITIDDQEAAHDVIRLSRMKNMPPEMISAKMARLPSPVQAILARAA